MRAMKASLFSRALSEKIYFCALEFWRKFPKLSRERNEIHARKKRHAMTTLVYFGHGARAAASNHPERGSSRRPRVGLLHRCSSFSSLSSSSSTTTRSANIVSNHWRTNDDARFRSSREGRRGRTARANAAGVFLPPGGIGGMVDALGAVISSRAPGLGPALLANSSVFVFGLPVLLKGLTGIATANAWFLGTVRFHVFYGIVFARASSLDDERCM